MTLARKLLSLDRDTIRAAWWTRRALASVRNQLSRTPYDQLRVEDPPRLPRAAGRGVEAVLRRQPATCLQRALVLQRWLLSQGLRRDVVIGVTGAGDFQAHAWLDGEPVPRQFRELTRLPAA